MGVRESWNELGTGGKVLVGLLVGGVVLVVGLVLLVILAAVLGSFVLGMGEPAAQASPQLSVAFDYDDSTETVEIIHDGGDSVEAADLLIETEDGTFGWEDPDGTVSAGDSTVVDASPGTKVQVVWVGGEETTVLAEMTTQ